MKTTPDRLRKLADRLGANDPDAAAELRGAADDIEAMILQAQTDVVDIERTLEFIERMLEAMRIVNDPATVEREKAPP